MLVLLMRHGDAIDLSPGGQDSERWLSPEGRARVRRVALVLRDRGVDLSSVWSSPKVRAVQTAELVVQGVGTSVEVRIHPPLAESDPLAALTPSDEAVAGGAVLLVGHMPLIATMSAHLAGTGRRVTQRSSFLPAMVHGHESRGSTSPWVIDPREC